MGRDKTSHLPCVFFQLAMYATYPWISREEAVVPTSRVNVRVKGGLIKILIRAFSLLVEN